MEDEDEGGTELDEGGMEEEEEGATEVVLDSAGAELDVGPAVVVAEALALMLDWTLFTPTRLAFHLSLLGQRSIEVTRCRRDYRRFV